MMFIITLFTGMTKNPSFINEVASQFGKDDEIIIVRPVLEIISFSIAP